MRYIYDNDLHIHSKISDCSRDENQTNERILQYAKDNNLKTICVTDHFWDETVDGASEWYAPQNFEHISAAKPLPTADGIQFLFGCETELDMHMRLGLSPERYDEFDFIVIPTTHMGGISFTISEEDAKGNVARARLWVERLEAVLNMELPFYKIGIAHLTLSAIGSHTREDYIEVLNMIKPEDMERLFKKAAKLGCGIEINSLDMRFSDEESDVVLRPYRIAKQCGCKFYMGSDAHHPEELDNAKALFEKAIDLLKLSEDDKFYIRRDKNAVK